MKKFILLWLMLLALPTHGQVIVGNYSIQYVFTAPSGACSQNAPLRLVIPGGILYACQNGTWAVLAGAGGGGSVTNIATTSPITGGPITTTGTLACPTCVAASSPGAGIARFAGSTQTATSAEVSGDCTTSGSNAITCTKTNTVAFGTFATANAATPPVIGNTTPAAITGTTVIGTVAVESGAFASAASTNAVNFQGGQDAGSSSTLGSGVFRGANNTSTGNAGNATLQAGRNTNATPGVQGWATVIESFVTASSLSTTFNVVSGTSTADQIAATGLGALTGVVGIAQTVGGTNTQVNVASYGKTTVRFDGTPVIGDTVCAPPPTTGTAGLAHDNSTTACTTSSLIGVVTGQVSGSGSGATATVLLKLN